jgi:hypothetical protein
MTQPRFFTFSQAQRACRPAPRSPLPSHNTRTRARTHRQTQCQSQHTHAHTRTHTRCGKPHTPQRHVRVMARVTKHSAHQQATHGTRHIAHSHAAYKHKSPARPDDVPHSRNQCARAARTSLHAHRHTRATHSTAHSSAHPTHRPQKITPSHTHGLCAALTSELSGCPASTGCCRRVGCCTSTTPCRTHEQPSRHTTAPEAITYRSASYCIKSSQMKASQHTACYRPLTTPCASDPENDATRQPTAT